MNHSEALIVVEEMLFRLRTEGRQEEIEAVERLLSSKQDSRRDATAVHFPVAGAGELEVGMEINHRCGSAKGVAIGVSWGRFGYAGGVLDRSDVEALVKHLQSLLGGK